MEQQPSLSPSIVSGILDSRYVSVAGLTVLLWDHCLTFEQERRLIWPSRASFVKWAFLCNRYLVPVLLILDVHTQSGISSRGLTDLFCKGWTTVVCFSGVLSMGVSHFLVLLKLWEIWEGKRDLIIPTTIAFLVTQTGAIVFMGLTAREAWPVIRFNPTQKMCALTRTLKMLRGVWGSLIVFEVVMFMMVCFGSLSRPREGRRCIMEHLYRDGICFFIALTALRVVNLIMAIKAPASQIFLGIYCVWSLLTTMVSRMIMSLREEKLVMREAEASVVSLKV